MRTHFFQMKQTAGSEEGSALIITMLLLVVLTIIGVAATNTSFIEILTANAAKRKQAAFYAAEAGMQHALKLLHRKFAEVKTGDPNADWDFMLDGSQTKPGGGTLAAATAWEASGGVPYLTNEQLPGNEYTYDVLIYNNVDGGSNAMDDMDGIIVIRAIGRGVAVNGGYAALEMALSCASSDRIEEEKRGQEGAGTGKNYNTNDGEAVDLVADDTTSVNVQL